MRQNKFTANKKYSDLSAEEISVHEKYMLEALKEAEKAALLGEVPVGAVIVRDGEIIARAHNLRETEKNALCHAETSAIESACRILGGWRLIRCTLYVTLEPCPMCAGAIINARIPAVIYGAKDPKAGAFGSVINLNSYPLNHKTIVFEGIMERECREILVNFFKLKRN